MTLKPELPTSKGDRLDSRWYIDDEDQEDKEKTTKLLRNNSVIFDKFKRIVQQEFEATIADGEKDFTEGWAYREAFNKGQQKAYKKIYKAIP